MYLNPWYGFGALQFMKMNNNKTQNRKQIEKQSGD